MNRLVFIDVSKVIATFLVVFGHLFATSSTERLFIYAFHMHFFFLISGIFHKKSGFCDNIKKSVNTILVPTALYILITICYKTIVSPIPLITIVKSMVIGIVYGYAIPYNGVLWFLFSLFHVKIIANEFLRNKICGLLLYVVLIILHLVIKDHFFFVEQSLMAVPFFLVGHYAKDYICKCSGRKRYRYLFIPMLLATFGLTIINGRVSFGGCSFGHAIFPLNAVLFYINGLVGSIMLLSLSFWVTRRIVWVENISKSLITVVGMQSFFLEYLIRYFGDQPNYLLAFVECVLIVFFCYLIHKYVIAQLLKYIPQL